MDLHTHIASRYSLEITCFPWHYKIHEYQRGRGPFRPTFATADRYLPNLHVSFKRRKGADVVWPRMSKPVKVGSSVKL